MYPLLNTWIMKEQRVTIRRSAEARWSMWNPMRIAFAPVAIQVSGGWPAISFARGSGSVDQEWGRPSRRAVRKESPMQAVETSAVRRGFLRSMNSAWSAPRKGNARMSSGAIWCMESTGSALQLVGFVERHGAGPVEQVEQESEGDGGLRGRQHDDEDGEHRPLQPRGGA